MAQDLPRLFQKRGIPVHSTAMRVRPRRKDLSVEAEYDLVVRNGECIVVIETKTTLSEQKLDKFIAKLKLFREHYTEYWDRKIYGGIAYTNADQEVIESAQERGLLLIQAPGGENNVTTIINPLDFVPTTY